MNSKFSYIALMKKLNKYINSYFTILILLVSAGLFPSCSDNSVSPKSNTESVSINDSLIFDWKYILIEGTYIVDIYIADTDKIFIAGTPTAFYFNNGILNEINYNDTRFSIFCVDGFNEKNVYFGGACSFPCIKPMLKKWNGSSIEDIFVPEDSSRAIKNFAFKSLSDIWMGSMKYFAYHYNGSQVSEYRLPDSVQDVIVFNDQYNNLYAFGRRIISIDSTATATYYFITYKFDGSEFGEISREIVNDRTSEIQDICSMTRNSIFRRGNSSLYRFNSGYWEKICIPNNSFTAYFADGYLFSDIMCEGRNTNFLWGYEIYYFNGTKWFRQSNIQHPLHDEQGIKKIIKRFDRYYTFFEPEYLFRNYLIIATYTQK